MDAAYRRKSTEQVDRFLNNLWQHQQKKEFCDFTLTTNNSSMECHKVVLSSASSYFTELFRVPKQNINNIDVTPLPAYVLKTVVAFMYNSEYVIDDENVIELLKLSRTWDLDILVGLCLAYMNENVSINNACRFYNFASDNVDDNESQLLNEYIREHFTSLHESGQLSELSLKNFTIIIEHDEIDVKNEDVIFSTAVRIIDQQASVEDINRCLTLIRFQHTSGDFLLDVVQEHPLMKKPPQNRYVREALRYQVNRRSAQEVKPRRQWQRGIYYIGDDNCLYQYVAKAGNDEFIKAMDIPGVTNFSIFAVALHRKRLVIVDGSRSTHAMLLDMADKTNVKLPNLPQPVEYPGVVLTDDAVFVFGGRINNLSLKTVYYLSLGDDTWQTMPSMPHAVSFPLVVQHQQYIYVLGGRNRYDDQQSVSQYNMADSTWKQCSDMPVICSSDDAGVVIHGCTITVFTRDKCFLYNDDTDTWTVQKDGVLDDIVNAFVKRGQIWAATVDKDRSYSLKSYDDEKNVWKTEKKNIKNAWYTRYFF